VTFTVAVEPLPGGQIARAKICAGHLTQDPAQPNLPRQEDRLSPPVLARIAARSALRSGPHGCQVGRYVAGASSVAGRYRFNASLTKADRDGAAQSATRPSSTAASEA